MKILVTGGSGFLGSHTADALSKAGHEVDVFDIEPSTYLRDDQSQTIGSVCDPEALNDALADCDAVYHFAAVADIDLASENPRNTVEVNILGTLNVLEAARKKKVQRMVFASSIYVYSKQGSFYRTSKQASELLVQDYEERYGLTYTILRFGSLYGPRSDESNAVRRMLLQALNERRIEYAGTGKEVREYIHVVDAAEAAVEILDTAYENQIIHLTGRERITTREMMEMIQEMFGGDIELITGDGTLIGHYVQTPYSYTPKLGRKFARHTYIDLGLGLLNFVEALDQEEPDRKRETG